MSYNSFKRLLLERFGSPQLTISKYFKIKQAKDEKVKDFIQGMETTGRKLKLDTKVRTQAIKQGLIRSRFSLRVAMAGKEKITKDILRKLQELEALEIERETYREKKKLVNKCFSKECKPQYLDKLVVNEIKEVDKLAENSGYIWVGQNRVVPIMDTGSQDNYMSESMAKELKMHTRRLQNPIIRYTCLGDEFTVTHHVVKIWNPSCQMS